jgi:hypothetical protein
MVELPDPPVIVLGEKLGIGPVGVTVAVSATETVKPPLGVTATPISTRQRSGEGRGSGLRGDVLQVHDIEVIYNERSQRGTSK